MPQMYFISPKNENTHPHALIIWRSTLFAVKAVPQRPRLPGQHEGTLQPSAYSFSFSQYLQPIELTSAPQIFLLLLTNKNWTNLWEGVPEVVGRKAGSPVPRTLAANAMFCIITLFLSPWFAQQ